jgi:hypothetical protein
MSVLLIILGALLAVGGSFLAQRNQLIIDKRVNDQKLALEVVMLLYDYNCHIETLSKLPRKSATLQSKLDLSKEESDIVSILHRLVFMALKFESKENITLSFELSKFCLEENVQTAENVEKLITLCNKLINPELVARLHREFG